MDDSQNTTTSDHEFAVDEMQVAAVIVDTPRGQLMFPLREAEQMGLIEIRPAVVIR